MSKLSKSKQELAKMRRDNKRNDGAGGGIIPSYVTANYNPHAAEQLVSLPQCPGYCHTEQEYPSTGLAQEMGGIGPFVHDSWDAYQNGVWDLKSQVPPQYAAPVERIEIVADFISRVIQMVNNSNGPSINTNPITPTPSPTRPTGTPNPTATGVTPTITWTPSQTATLTISPTLSATALPPTPTSTPTVTTTTTPVYWVP